MLDYDGKVGMKMTTNESRKWSDTAGWQSQQHTPSPSALTPKRGVARSWQDGSHEKA